MHLRRRFGIGSTATDPRPLRSALVTGAFLHPFDSRPRESFITPDLRQDAGSMHDCGVIVRPIGDRSITFCRPLVTTDGQIDTIVDTLVDALAAATEAG